jgi:sugar/nucleoside kinase (ribokinase family)
MIDRDVIDLVVVGGLTIDRFDGRLVPGGSVLHATRSAAHAGLRTAVVTMAGPEPTAGSGLDELARLATQLTVQPAPETIRFRHRETEAGRRLWLEARGGTMDPAHTSGPQGAAILFAPVASEVPADALEDRDAVRRRGAILQGWLRRAAAGGEVEPIRPDALDAGLLAALARLDVLVASREDLAAAADAPPAQLGALRAQVGPAPVLVVTDGHEGVWLDDGNGETRHLAAPWRVSGVPMVGAGDAFAALFVTALGTADVRDRLGVDAAAERAMRGVAEMLEARRS